MKLLIKEWRDAINYVPNNQEYAIRLFSSPAKEKINIHRALQQTRIK
ncbi:hypothetical protein HYT57_00865 [Candidatus Woesearchaeota archaeon]|nr:hypothetical protein [Candidatus Woesearchaeota archaeon]